MQWERHVKSWPQYSSATWNSCMEVATEAPACQVSLLWPLECILRMWPGYLQDATLEELPDWLVGETGPYGSGCAKGPSQSTASQHSPRLCKLSTHK
eukprot:6459426-Amphidinium_carterae.3